ncbi:MAG: HAMP domain-containing protein [Chloroflexi bacterium]|nr:HAMP domain-containing protein [Chloroflexota bacterium]
MPIQLRLTFWYAVLLALALTVFSLGVYLTLEVRLSAAVDRSLEIRTQDFLWTISPGSDLNLQPHDLAELRLDLLSELETPGLFIQVLDTEGKVIGRSPNLERGFLPSDIRALNTALLGNKSAYATVTVADERQVRVLTTPIKVHNEIVGLLQVAETLQPLRETLGSTRNTLILSSLMTLLFAIAGGWFLGRRALAPIAAITHAAQRIRETGDYSSRVGLPGPRDEVRELAATFDSLIAQVHESLERHREFLADSSHELRSPLTVIRGNIDLLRRPLDEVSRRQVLGEMQREADFMRRIVGDLLLLAQVEAHQVIDQQPVRLHRLLEKIVQRYDPLDAGSRITLGRRDDVTVIGDSDRLQQVIVNLVDNALRYTSTDGSVTLTLTRTSNGADLVVRDTGRGIAPEHLPHVFKRFYRADKSRSRAEGHAGLGLAIVKYVVEAHGGTVTVSSKPGQGTTFVVSLPIATAEPPVAPAAAATSARRLNPFLLARRAARREPVVEPGS